MKNQKKPQPERVTLDAQGFVTGIEPVEPSQDCGECAHSQKYRGIGMMMCRCDLKDKDVPLNWCCPDWKELVA